MNAPDTLLARAESIGNEAGRALSAARWGRVVAVFERAFYVRLGEGWACIGHGEIGRGPLNIPCEAIGPRDWRDVVEPGSGVVRADSALVLENGRVFLGSAPPWAPAPVPSSTEAALAAGLWRLRSLLPRDLPEGGLAAFARAEHERAACPSSRIERTAAPAISALEQWLASAGPATACPRSAVRTLLGLGPGLTPSGDDFIAGVAAALRALHRHSRVRALAAEVEAMAPQRTGDISLCHLRAAIRVGLREDLHMLLRDVIGGHIGAIAGGLARLGDADHHSPWDALAGVVTGLHGTLCLAAAQRRPMAGFLWQNDRDLPRSVSPNPLQLMRW